MKKYIVVSIISICAVQNAYALSLIGQACPNLSGITTGTKCKDLSDSDRNKLLLSRDCADDLSTSSGGGLKDSCVVTLCNGTCTCTTGLCGGGSIIDPTDPIDPIVLCASSCIQDITWGLIDTSGRQIGTVSLKSGTVCGNCATQVYRCASGYYSSNSSTPTGFESYDVSTDALKCTACPAASDDSDTYWSYVLPSYTASKAGLPKISDCYAKANSPINTSRGKYVYTSNCFYTAGS